MSNKNKYAIVYNDVVVREIELLSPGAKAPKRGGGWVANEKLNARAAESLADNPNIKLSSIAWPGYEMALNIILPEDSEIITGGKINAELMIKHLELALNKQGERGDFGLVEIGKKSTTTTTTSQQQTTTQPEIELQKINYSQGHAKIVMDGTGEVWSFASNSINWERLVEISKEGGGWYVKELQARKGFTPEKAKILAKRHGVALVNADGLTVVAENINKQVAPQKQPDRGTRGKTQEQRPRKVTPQDINLYRGGANKQLTKSPIYHDYTIEQIEDMLCHLLNETSGKVSGKLDTVVSGEGTDNETITISATGKNGDYGSLTIEEGIGIILMAANWGVHPINDMDYWVQFVKDGTDYVALTKSLSYKKLAHVARITWKLYHPDHVLAMPSREMTGEEKKTHKVGTKYDKESKQQVELCGWVTKLISHGPYGPIEVGEGWAVAPYSSNAKNRADTFYAVKGSLVDALNKAGLEPSAETTKAAMRKLLGNTHGEFESFANEFVNEAPIAKKAVAELPPPVNDDLDLEFQLNELEGRRQKVKVQNYDDIGGDVIMGRV